MPTSSSHRPVQLNLDLFNAIAHHGKTFQQAIVWQSKWSKDGRAALAFERTMENSADRHRDTRVLGTTGRSGIIIFTFGTREFTSDNVR